MSFIAGLLLFMSIFSLFSPTPTVACHDDSNSYLPESDISHCVLDEVEG
jgi:hypothetical protein